MANNNPASPWRKDFRVMTRNENIEQYQAEQKRRAFAMRNMRKR